MKGFLFRLVITALGLWAAETIIPGIHIDRWDHLIIAALLLGIVNAVIRPVILILTLPLTVLTLGLFIFVVNGISFYLVHWLVPGFSVSGLGAAVLGSIVGVRRRIGQDRALSSCRGHGAPPRLNEGEGRWRLVEVDGG